MFGRNSLNFGIFEIESELKLWQKNEKVKQC